uniref:Ig-like domain-containing protein n=1 Tax=Meleagris gallopavo TaxID=9103 RepID=A0A803Y747_MELGA
MLLRVQPSVSSQHLGMVPFCCLSPNTRNKPPAMCTSKAFRGFIQYKHPTSFTSFSHIAENVYVKTFTNSPTLVCMDLPLSQDEVIDPKYSWTGPDGRKLEGQGYANLTSSGELVLVGFQESMSGAYKCALSHRIIETSAQKEVDVTNTYRFMVYAYREANHVYQVSVRFTSKGCELAANARFVEELKKILEDLISDLTCRVGRLSYRCHSLEVPHRGSPSELFITFQGNGGGFLAPNTPGRPPAPTHTPARPFPSAAAAFSLPSPQMEPERSGSARSAQSKAELQSPEVPVRIQPGATARPPARLISPSPLPTAQIGPTLGRHRRSPASPFPKPTPSKRREPFPKLRWAVAERRRNPGPSHMRGKTGGRGG